MNIPSNDLNLIRIFDALADPGRLKIFKLLINKRDVCVSDVAEIMKISVPAASRQLKILETAGLARRIRNGQMICYVINQSDPIVKAIKKFL